MIKTRIEEDGQSYVDEPIVVYPKPVTKIEQACGIRQPQPIIVGYERVRLRWMRPDGKGGLVPR